ncbi:MAG: lysoplasmalogenase family protein [Candidatus Limivicinus sp.]|jgi:uncharacterized membrane protein YhhN
MNKVYLYIAGALLTAACALGAYCYMKANKMKDYRRAFWLKGAAGLAFVLLGLAAALARDDKFGWLVFSGLVFGLAGDQLLALRFVYADRHDFFFACGVLSFGVGHVLYITALQKLVGVLIGPSFGILALWMVGSAIYAIIRKSNAGELQLFGVVYIGLVAFMSAVAVSSAFVRPNAGTLLFAVGGFSFLVSDNILSAYCFGNKKCWGMNIAVHATYYAAQLMIAWSIAFV